MNEQTQQALAELLQKAVNGVDSITAFSQAQLPEVINQLLMWNFVSSLLTQVGCIAYLIGFSLVAKRVFQYCKDNRDGDSVIFVVLGLIFAWMVALVAIATFFDNFVWIKIWLAPKLYLLEYASQLLK